MVRIGKVIELGILVAGGEPTYAGSYESGLDRHGAPWVTQGEQPNTATVTHHVDARLSCNMAFSAV